MEVCLNKNFIRFALNKNNEHIKLLSNKGVFKPTETTKFLKKKYSFLNLLYLMTLKNLNLILLSMTFLELVIKLPK